MGALVTLVHRDLTKWELLLTAPQAVIFATGEGMLIFSAWHISTITHCQIILNMSDVTRCPCSQYSDLLCLINSATAACHWPINQDNHRPPQPLAPPKTTPFFFFHLSAYLNMRWRLDGFHKISFGENKVWKSWIFDWGILSAFSFFAKRLLTSYRSLFQDLVLQ